MPFGALLGAAEDVHLVQVARFGVLPLVAQQVQVLHPTQTPRVPGVVVHVSEHMELPLIVLTRTRSLTLSHALRPIRPDTAHLLLVFAPVLPLEAIHELGGDLLDLAAEGTLLGVLEAVVVLQLGELQAHAAPQEVMSHLLFSLLGRVMAQALLAKAVLEGRGRGAWRERFQGV